MNVTDFCSSNSYIYLPTKKNPKVALVVETPLLANNAFKLYNPFSQKAKLFKKTSQLLFAYATPLAKKIFGSQKFEKSKFISYLENKLDQKLVVSLYFATVGDKIVLQLQTPEAKIVGYLKYPLNDIGLKHLENEKNAIEILSEKNIIQKYILHDNFASRPFLLLTALDGKIGLLERSYINEMLLRFKREKVYILSEHPRIKILKNSVPINMPHYLRIIEKVCQKSTIQYSLVYEHGDYTPWNIVKVDNEYIPFDFEYFVEDGLEFFDLIKYYYQIGKLLENRRHSKLFEYIQSKVTIPEIFELLQLFLIEEIIRGHEENEPFDIELELLEYLENK